MAPPAERVEEAGLAAVIAAHVGTDWLEFGLLEGLPETEGSTDGCWVFGMNTSDARPLEGWEWHRVNRTRLHGDSAPSSLHPGHQPGHMVKSRTLCLNWDALSTTLVKSHPTPSRFIHLRPCENVSPPRSPACLWAPGIAGHDMATCLVTRTTRRGGAVDGW